jgi:hypothetical protein
MSRWLLRRPSAVHVHLCRIQLSRVRPCPPLRCPRVRLRVCPAASARPHCGGPRAARFAAGTGSRGRSSRRSYLAGWGVGADLPGVLGRLRSRLTALPTRTGFRHAGCPSGDGRGARTRLCSRTGRMASRACRVGGTGWRHTRRLGLDWRRRPHSVVIVRPWVRVVRPRRTFLLYRGSGARPQRGPDMQRASPTDADDALTCSFGVEVRGFEP